MQTLLSALAEYCDGCGAEDIGELRTVQEALRIAQTLITHTFFAQQCRLDGRIVEAIEHESRADVAMSNLWKLAE